MLNAKELAKRLKAAMDNRRPPLRSVDLAKKCGVTPQAVNGWRSTGRVAKRHLYTIAEETGQPIEFFLEDERGTSKATKSAWQRISAPLVLALALLSPYSADQANAFVSPIVAHVHYVKTWLMRLRRRFALSYHGN